MSKKCKKINFEIFLCNANCLKFEFSHVTCFVLFCLFVNKKNEDEEMTVPVTDKISVMLQVII